MSAKKIDLTAMVTLAVDRLVVYAGFGELGVFENASEPTSPFSSIQI